MYSYVCLPPGEGIWPRLQSLTYTYLPAPLLLPPIQTHNFCSRPAGLSTAPREFHCFYGATLASTPPWWLFPRLGAATLGLSFPAAGAPEPSQPAPNAEGWGQWPEGRSLQLQLRWGRVERTRGPPLPLPDAVRRELRRVYGTYPRTDVRVTRRGSQFLLQAAPRVGEPEYQVARGVVRRPAGGDDDGDGGDSRAAPEAVQRGRPKKKQGLR